MESNSSWSSKISISKEISDCFPDICLAFLSGKIINATGDQNLWDLIQIRSRELSLSMDEEQIRQFGGIPEGKQAYRHLGKDPNRYRLSAEALMRRAAKGKGLYSISSAVDALNLVSLNTGVTIGGFDADLIQGDVTLGIGRLNENFMAIGRGPLNIENLPVYRDQQGAIGNPTADCVRTQITHSTEHILMLITGFYGSDRILSTVELLKELLHKFCRCTNCQTGLIGIER